MKFQNYLAIVLTLSVATPAFAMTLREESFTCPIGGETFSQTIPSSGSSFGMRTDFMKLGAISSPWRLPQCPTNHFVMYEDKFSSEEIAKFTQAINSPEFLAIPKDAPQYYYLAKQLEIAQQLGLTSVATHDIGSAYLQASWQKGDAKDYRQKALQYFQQALPNLDNQSEKWKTISLLVGELYRLLGQFDMAKAHFTDLQKQPFAQNGMVKNYIAFELKLIEQKNSLPQTVPQ